MPTELSRTNALVIKLQDYQVGVINRLAGDRYIFAFDQNYLDDPQRPTLSLSFKSQTGGVISSLRPFHLRLPPFFSNLLPEGTLLSYLAKHIGVKPEREFFLLAALGADLPGAVTAMPMEIMQAEMHEKLYSEREGDKQIMSNALRFSLAGVQLKFSALLNATGGLTIPRNGINGSWIIKLPSMQFPEVPENEFVMLSLARSIGINVPDNKLVDIKEVQGMPKDIEQLKGKALAIKRFDRASDGQRIHMEDFAQVFGFYPHNKYEKKSYANIASVLWGETSEASCYEFIRRLVFSVLIGNADMHLKNWSLLYPDGRNPVLSPAYDLVSTIVYLSDDQLALSFGGSRRLTEITPDQVRRFTNSVGMPSDIVARLVLETVSLTVEAWNQLAQKTLLSKAMMKSIDRQIQTVAVNTERLFN